MKKNKEVLFVAAVHGDESIGVEAMKNINRAKTQRTFDWIVANKRALRENRRFVDYDLNRVFPGNKKGKGEKYLAYQLTKKMDNYAKIIALHGTVSKTGIFIILTKLTFENLRLALKFDLRRIVFWPDPKKSSGSLPTFVRCGLEVEAGSKDSIQSRKKLEKILADFIRNYPKEIDLKKEMGKREFYRVIGSVKVGRASMQRYRDWKKVKEWYPLFVGQYPGIVCCKLRKMKPEKINALMGK